MFVLFKNNIGTIMDTVGNRIKKIMDHLNLNYNSFSKELGYSDVVVGNVIKGRNKPSFDFVNKLTQTFDWVDVRWILTGQGEMLLENNITNKTKAVYKLKTDNLVDNQAIPLYDIEAVAGLVPLFTNAQETKPIDHISIPHLPKCDGAVHITGDSMYPLLKSGDIIMYKEIQDIANDIFWGEMYLLSISMSGEEMVVVKFIQKSEKGEGYVKLVSQNKHHQDRDIKITRIMALALVKASVRINSMS